MICYICGMKKKETEYCVMSILEDGTKQMGHLCKECKEWSDELVKIKQEILANYVDPFKFMKDNHGG